MEFSPFRITPPSGPTVPPYGGHWSGNVSTTRYEVFPSGAYPVGDEWRRVAAQIDYGGNVSNCMICGSTSITKCSGSNTPNIFTEHTCAGLNGGCPPGKCCNNWACSPWSIGFCFPCTRDQWDPVTITTCNTCWVPNWFTRYDRFKYEYFQWTYLGSFEVAGQFSA